MARKTGSIRKSAPKYQSPSPFVTYRDEKKIVVSLSIPQVISLCEGLKDRSTTGNGARYALTYDEAIAHLRNGWIADRVDLSTPSLAHTSFEQVLDVTGSFPDVSAYIAGDPECMAGFVSAPPAAKVVTLLVDVGGSWDIDPEDFFQRGRIVLSFLDSLESRGIRCEVLAWMGMRADDGIIGEMRIKIKGAQDPIDRSMIDYCLGHPAFFRRNLFGAADALVEHNVLLPLAAKVDSGRGYGCHLPSGMNDLGELCAPGLNTLGNKGLKEYLESIEV